MWVSLDVRKAITTVTGSMVKYFKIQIYTLFMWCELKVQLAAPLLVNGKQENNRELHFL